MVWSIESKNNPSESRGGFFDFLVNLKDFVVEKFNLLKQALIDLNILKWEIKLRNSPANAQSSNEHPSSGEMVSGSNEVVRASLKEKLTQICVRSRTYWAVNQDDCWSVSFWKLQFHGSKAENILNAIKKRNPSRYSSIMTDPLFRDIKTACDSKRNDNQKSQFQKLMQDSWAKHEMDRVVDETIQSYLDLAHKWWVSDPRATLAFWRICNYWPWFAEKIKNMMVKAWANINDYSQVIDYYEKNTSWHVSTKFSKPIHMFWGKNLRQVIGEYSA